MNDVINIYRLYMLIARHWFENRRLYILFLSAIIVLLSGWFIFFLLVGNPFLFSHNNQLIIYFMGLFISGCLSAAFLIRDFSNKPQKINYLLLPAAAFEKLTCILFYGVFLFFIAYTVIFYATDFFALKMANSTIAGLMTSNSRDALQWRQQFGITQPLNPASMVNVFSPGAGSFIFSPGDNIELFTAFFPLQSAFILGSIYFRKNSLFKTIVALLGCFLLFFIINGKILMPLFPRSSQIFGTFTVLRTFDGDGTERIYSLPSWIGQTAGFLVTYLITPVLWLATYYRLKENEI